MKKKIIFCLLLLIALILPLNKTTASADEIEVYLGGMPAGFTMQTKGAHVVGLSDVVTESGTISPAKDADIRVGDVILSIDDIEINNALDIEKAINKLENKTVCISRGGEKLIKDVTPAKDVCGNNRLGVFVKDCINGIGTITFFTKERFASLGHPVLDDNGGLLSIRNGELYDCAITGVVRGERGKAGELRGVFIKDKPIANIDKNATNGVYGKIDDQFIINKGLTKISIGEGQMGSAYIYTTIDGGEPCAYKVSVVKSERDRDTKNFVIKITDKRLLEKTGGIVQGMSGSPIVQDGKLIGAVTHVFINDPTRGFGISINNMLNN
ncbi:MAG: SpoIVB peptidase [Clostridia bacterium]|nr:SpoIVB peptidase [Clostridia bacterium]